MNCNLFGAICLSGGCQYYSEIFHIELRKGSVNNGLFSIMDTAGMGKMGLGKRKLGKKGRKKRGSLGAMLVV